MSRGHPRGTLLGGKNYLSEQVMFALLSCAAVNSIAASAQAQTAAKILGIVRDQHGKPLAAASVDVAGQRSSAHRKASTDPSGAFVFPELPPDTYQVSAGCETCNDASNIVEVGAGQARFVQLELNTESSLSVVSLDTEGTTVDSSSARQGINVAATEIASLPVNGRSFSPLALAAPLVSNSRGAAFADLRFAGQSAQQNRYTFDDIDDSSIISAEPGFVPLAGYEFRLRNSLDTVDQFRVDSAGYSVEDGSRAGGQIKLVSKAASDRWHASLFEYFRDDKLQARNFFERDGKTELRMNQFGASAGGPLIRNKLYLFSSFERLRQAADVDLLETVPSAIARSTAAPSILPVLQGIPLGSKGTADPEIDQASWQHAASQDEANYGVRLDYIASPAHRFFVRYSRSSGVLDAPDYSTTDRMIAAVSRPDQSIANWSYQLSPSAVGQLTLGLNRAPTRVAVRSGTRALAGTRILVGNEVDGQLASPGDQIQLLGGVYGNAADYHGRSYNLRNTFDWSSHSHSFQSGIEFQAVRVPFTTSGGLTYSFRDLNSLLANRDSDITYISGIPPREAEAETYGGFIQDQWRLSNQMQLVLGLRYDYFSATREARNRASLFDYNTFQYQAVSGAFYRASKLGLEPRAAFTWSPKATQGKTVLRLGAGLYNGPNAFLSTLSPIANSFPKLFLRQSAYPIAADQLLASPNVIQQPRGLDLGTFGLPQRNYFFSASVQQVLPAKLTFETGYTGILSRHLTEQGEANLWAHINAEDGYTERSRAGYSLVPYLMNGGDSSYQALHVGLNRRLVDNLTMTASFSVSHSIGNTQGAGEEDAAQDPRCLACERSDNDFDIRRVFSLNVVYGLPFGKAHPYLRSGVWSSVLGDWTAAGTWNLRSGLPVNVLIDRADEIYYSPSKRRYYSPFVDIPPDAIAILNTPGGLEGSGTLRPNYVAGANPYLKDGLDWLNPAAFSIPDPGTLGNLGRNALRGPGFNQLDLQLSRSFSFKERARLKASVEVFNAFNRANFSNPSVLLPDVTADVQPGAAYTRTLAPGFGALNSTVGRTVGLGTSRQWQLSLRLEF